MINQLIDEVGGLRQELLACEKEGLVHGPPIHPSYYQSARNLLHYMALRGRDIRPLQERLAQLGLSSLGRSEAHVLASVNTVWHVLHRLARRDQECLELPEPAIEPHSGRDLLARHTESLLGPKPADRNARIMVTLPTDAAHNPTLLRTLLQAGMNCARINCAHDDVPIWQQMIRNLRAAQSELNVPCKVLMDLAGPKIRTSPVTGGPHVVKWRPRRDEFGRVTAPARIRLVPQGSPIDSRHGSVHLPVPRPWLQRVCVGDRIEFVDARGARRFLWVVSEDNEGFWAEAVRTAYITPGTTLQLRNSNRRKEAEALLTAHVGNLEPLNPSLTVKSGEHIVLTRTACASDLRRDTPDSEGIAPLPEVFHDVEPGEHIWFDDGKIGGLIETVTDQEILVRITHAPLQGAKLRGDKGINLPDSSLSLPSLTAKDLADLPFIAAHADLVGYSFVRSAEDVVELENRLTELGGAGLGIVLKIETRRAFEELPSLLLAAMRSPCDGVMIARGDLAIECGYERLAEVQEQILWVCEAAHVPVIWATQVLENLAKVGQPSRAEISDAAIGQRAECVMLNKGPHIVQAVQCLADILRRMEAHQSKKQSTLRPLNIARRFLEKNAPIY